MTAADASLLSDHREQVNTLAANAGVRFFDYQLAALAAAGALSGPSQRLCLYYRTGAGKTITALACVALWGHDAAVVVAPPSTHSQWVEMGKRFGIAVEPMSHAKFRQPATKLSRSQPIIADEMHLFGGYQGQGWKKLDRTARHLQAPLVLASATPNYNDAERVYCIQHVLNSMSCRGGFLEFLYAHCVTKQNPFGTMPLVEGFQRYPDAAAYLAALPGVEYLPDELTYTIGDISLPPKRLDEFETYGLNRRAGRIMASQMEERHARVNLRLVDEYGKMQDDVYNILLHLTGSASTPVLVFAVHATVAEALGASLRLNRVEHAVVHGGSTLKAKEAAIRSFRAGELTMLVGTASLATGTDGLDKVCDTLIILDDTDDDSLRRQLIGRIMPRGADADASKKQVYRLVLQ